MKTSWPNKASANVGSLKGLMRNRSVADKSLLRSAILAINITNKLRMESLKVHNSSLEYQNELYELLQSIISNKDRGIPRIEIEKLIQSLKECQAELTLDSIKRESKPMTAKPNEVTAIKDKIGLALEDRAKERKEPPFSWAPFARIPNCKSFKIESGGFDDILKIFGLDKKNNPKLDIDPYNNANLVHYAKRMITYLRCQDLDERTYWETAHMLMGSRVFQLMAISKCFPRYHRELSLFNIFGIFDEIKSWYKTGNFELDFKRVYIPKPSKKGAQGEEIKRWRPLGVPKPVWRVYLSMYTWMLMTRYSKFMPHWQHGYMTGKGVLTAWKVILSQVVKSKYIWEFDLKGFFDNVDVALVSRQLSELGMPPKEIYQFQDICKGLPSLPEEEKLDESKTKIKEAINLAANPPKDTEQLDLGALLNSEGFAMFNELNFDWEKELNEETYPGSCADSTWWYETLREQASKEKSVYKRLGIMQQAGRQLIMEQLQEEGLPPNAIPGIVSETEVIAKIIEMQWMLFDSFRIAKETKETGKPAVSAEPMNEYFRGLPQGAPMSAFLSVLLLRNLVLKDGNELLMYADDGIIYGSNPIDTEDFASQLKEIGIELSRDKCRNVKEDGIWKLDLKFLGLKYLWETDEISSDTRSGAQHKFTLKEVVKADTLKEHKVPLTVIQHIEDRSIPFKGMGILSFVASYFNQELVPMSTGRVPVIPVRPQESTVSYVAEGSKEEVLKYFLRLVSGQVKVEETSVISTIRDKRKDFQDFEIEAPYEAEMIRLNRINEVLNQLSYKISYVPADLGDRINKMMVEGVTWEDTLNSRLYGWFISKMQWKGFVNTPVSQDFMLGWKAGTSWVAKRCQFEWIKHGSYHANVNFLGKDEKGGNVYIPVEFSNSTSLAFRDIIEQAEVRENSNNAMADYISGKISIEELNTIRFRLGRPPVKSTYCRRVKIELSQREFSKYEKVLPQEKREKRAARLYRIHGAQALEMINGNHGQRRYYHWKNVPLLNNVSLLVQEPMLETRAGRNVWLISILLEILCMIGGLVITNYIGLLLEVSEPELVTTKVEVAEPIADISQWWKAAGVIIGLIILVAITWQFISPGSAPNDVVLLDDSKLIPLICNTEIEFTKEMDNQNLIRLARAARVEEEISSPVLMHGYWE